MNTQDDTLKNIAELAENLRVLSEQAYREYAVVVNDIVREQKRDISHIERTLDGLLEFCCAEPVLVLYKRLCRYYFDIDPIATAYYVHAYREYWNYDP